jgi:predicted RNA binding protein YcfA (HicA-like mRNA interferase family)
MSKREKLLSRIKNSQKNIRFDAFCTLMTWFGFALIRVRGSHHLYQHPDLDEVMNVQPTKDNLAKAYQVREFLGVVELHDLRLEDGKDEADE